MDETNVITCRCGTCNQKLRIARPEEMKRDIKPCDFFMCPYCGKTSMFDKDMKLIDATPEDIAALRVTNPDAWAQMRQDAYEANKRAILN